MTRLEASFEFQKALKPLVAEGYLTDQGAAVVLDLFITHLDGYANSMIETIGEMVREWERFQLTDATLYSLGLRHAADVLGDIDPRRFRDNGTGVTEDDLL